MYNVGKGTALDMQFQRMVGTGEMIDNAMWYLHTAQHRGVFQSLLLAPPTEKKGILLVGPPGNGKTLLVRAIAGETGVPTIVIAGSVLQSALQNKNGMGGKQLQQIFQRAREKAPCIVFIDEIDSIGTKRSMLTESLLGTGKAHRGSRTLADILPSISEAKRFKDGMVESVQGQARSAATQKQKQNYTEQITSMMQLLMELDGLQGLEGVLVVGATNREWAMDEALLRPGRFNRKLYVPKPDEAKRSRIIKFYCRPINIDPELHLAPSPEPPVPVRTDYYDAHPEKRDWTVYDYLASRTEGFSAAELAGLVRRSGTEAMLAFMAQGAKGKVQHNLTTLEIGIEKIKPEVRLQQRLMNRVEDFHGVVDERLLPPEVVAFNRLGTLVRLQEQLLPPEMSRHEELNGSLWWRFRKYPLYTFLHYNMEYPWHLDLPLWNEYKEGGPQQNWVPADRYFTNVQHYQRHVFRMARYVSEMVYRTWRTMGFRVLNFYYMFCAFDDFREQFDIYTDYALRYPLQRRT